MSSKSKPTDNPPFVRVFNDLTLDDIPSVGGKNAALGELIGQLTGAGIRVPNGFATTADAYWRVLDANNLRGRISACVDDFHSGKASLAKTGKAIRRLFKSMTIPDDVAQEILRAYHALQNREPVDHLSVAVRSSATAEDLPEASFAGQQETFLNIEGDEDLLEACRQCYTSLFTDRAISYRETHGFDQMAVALSIGVQRMVRSDIASSGVMFTLDTETGFPRVVMINAAWGLGENVVKGSVNPDEYYVFKPLLADPSKRPILRKKVGAKEKTMIFAAGGHHTTKNIDTPKAERRRFALGDDDILQLARWAVTIEDHASRRRGQAVPMDIEWAKDGLTGELFIVQARPETVQSRAQVASLTTYTLKEKGKVLITGRSVGQSIASGPASVVKRASDIEQFKPGSVLVAEMTDPDWVPIMKMAAGIVTDHGGRTCHAAIVSRELGIPAIVGTGHATEMLADGQELTISCAEGDEGYVYEGTLKFEKEEVDLKNLVKPPARLMINLANPDAAFQWWRLPAEGVGLARMEFIITNEIRVHPMALLQIDRVESKEEREQIEALCEQFPDKQTFFIETLARGIATIAAAQHSHPVIVRMSDFKTNEYAGLLGGAAFEPKEENPMIGFRGASRYYNERYRPGFALECAAIRMARETIGMDNIVVMIPFCRTLEEADRVIDVMKAEGLERGRNGLKIYVMCEIPSNVILAKEFAERFDGFSIGSNDLTQLVLGVDRDSELLASVFDERNPAVKAMIRQVIASAHEANRPVGICGQAPSDHPEFASFLIEAGIDSISLNPDSVLNVYRRLTSR